MRNGLTIALLVLSGLSILATGAIGLSDPQTLFTPLGTQIAGVDAANEARAAYGGMYVALGLLILAATLRSHLRTPALWLTFAIMGGLTMGRLVSFVVDGIPGGFVFQLLLFEGTATVASAGLLFTHEAKAD